MGRAKSQYNFFGRTKSHKNSSVAHIGNILNLVEKIKTFLCEVEKNTNFEKLSVKKSRNSTLIEFFTRKS